MNVLKYIGLFALVLLVSCSNDSDDIIPEENNETENLQLVKTISNDTHSISLYNESGILLTGYNKLYFQIKNNNDEYVKNATTSWLPMMNMHNMSHSCPFSNITKTIGKETLYEGYIVFQMASNAMEYWELTINYAINGNEFSATEIIDVSEASKKRVNVFMGSDDVRYIIAMIEPTTPQVAINNMVAGVFKSESMMSYPIVDNYKVLIDPRMPGMGNHGSPNNEDLEQSHIDKLYHGKLSLTMTGYWKVNLQLLNTNGEVLKGEAVTEDNESSSIFFEVEF